jgi:hemolysin III
MRAIDHSTGAARPALRGIMHLVSAPVAGLAALWLVLTSPQHQVALSIYGIGLVALFTVSGSYHVIATSEARQKILRRLDHSTIFAFIAATYTPLIVIAVDGTAQTVAVLTIWTGAAVGAVAAFAAPKHPGVFALYLVLGWASVGLIGSVWAENATSGTLVAAGGAAYTAGAILFALQRPFKTRTVFGYHELWHTFTLTAAVCHFLAIRVLSLY